MLTGWVEMVQRAYNAQQHGVLVAAFPNTIFAVKSSVSTSPGQFRNFTLLWARQFYRLADRIVI